MSAKQKVRAAEAKKSETQYMEVSDNFKGVLQKCNLKKEELDIMVKTAQRIKEGRDLRDQKMKKDLLWKTLAKLIVSGGILEVKEATGEDAATLAKTNNEKFDEDQKEILEGNPKAGEGTTPEEEAFKDICPYFDRGPNLCKYGIVGMGCGFAHPETCIEFDKKGEIGCSSPCERGYHHRPVCKFLEKKEVCPGGQKCGPTKIYHPPELEKMVLKDAGKRDEEKKKKAKEAEERKAFLGETKKLKEENQGLKKEIEDLKQLLGCTTRSVPPPPQTMQNQLQTQQQPMQIQQLQDQVTQLQQQILTLQQNQLRNSMQQPMQQMGLRQLGPMMQQGQLQCSCSCRIPNQNMN